TWQTRAMIVAPVVLGMKVEDSSSKQGLASSHFWTDALKAPVKPLPGRMLVVCFFCQTLSTSVKRRAGRVARCQRLTYA
ncbi:MAG TPA: hypothetical protein PLD53_07100, partial [Candidatus Propionivibrio aalborgensis]|nr:hypothetical protein [Candidatus Propionivibrio aalborgensis]